MGRTSLVPAARASCVANSECLVTLLTLLDRFCTENQIDGEDQHDLHLIVEEACSNVISHAYPAGEAGPLSLHLEIKTRNGRAMVEITIEDQGKPFDPLALPEPDRSAPLEDLPPGGLGVLLVRRLSDQQRYTRDPQRGNVLTIARFLTPAGSD